MDKVNKLLRVKIKEIAKNITYQSVGKSIFFYGHVLESNNEVIEWVKQIKDDLEHEERDCE